MTQAEDSEPVLQTDVVARRRLRFADVALGFLIATVFATLCMGAMLKSGGGVVAQFWASQTGYWLVLVATVVFASRKRASGSLQHDFGFVVRRGDILRGIAIGLGCQIILVQGIYGLLGLAFDVSDADVAKEFIKKYGDGWHIYPLIAGLGVMSPLIEELFYRGLLFRTLAEWVRPKWCVVISALVFATLHFQLVPFIGLFAFGVVVGEIVRRTNRLGMSIAAHIAFNLSAFGIYFL